MAPALSSPIDTCSLPAATASTDRQGSPAVPLQLIYYCYFKSHCGVYTDDTVSSKLSNNLPSLNLRTNRSKCFARDLLKFTRNNFHTCHICCLSPKTQNARVKIMTRADAVIGAKIRLTVIEPAAATRSTFCCLRFSVTFSYRYIMQLSSLIERQVRVVSRCACRGYLSVREPARPRRVGWGVGRWCLVGALWDDVMGLHGEARGRHCNVPLVTCGRLAGWGGGVDVSPPS